MKKAIKLLTLIVILNLGQINA